MKLRVVLFLIGLLAFIILSGCALSTSTAEIIIENYYNEDFTTTLNGGDSKYLAAYGSVTYELEWSGLNDESFNVSVYDGGINGTLIVRDSVTVSSGEIVTLWW